MRYTDQQKWNMDRSEQELSPALHRLADADYTAGYFFVTLNVRDHHQVLSTIHGRYNVSTQTVENLEIEYTEVGKYVEQCWQQIPQFYPDVQVIANVVMPDHFHGLLLPDNNSCKSLVGSMSIARIMFVLVPNAWL